MKPEAMPLVAVPTNVLTGFPGAGKTSAILHLLQQKPREERWAVLVNEFGEIGVDGSLLSGGSRDPDGVHIAEVPGGCMCCAAGLPMQITLNRLLRRARPHRLLIEPTGLGHPVEVLTALSAAHNRNVLSLQKTLTLVDARHCSDERYTSHATFQQQLAVADIIVANKEDLYAPADLDALHRFLRRHGRDEIALRVTRQGRVKLEDLAGKPEHVYGGHEAHDDGRDPVLAAELPLPECGYVTAMNGGEGFESIGWRFSPSKIFDRGRLLSFLRSLAAERAKAVFITEAGIFGYNLTADALSEVDIDDCMESRIEIIAGRIDPSWEDGLLSCLRSPE